MKYSIVAVAIISCTAPVFADETIQVLDDRNVPVHSVVHVDGVRIKPTDETGNVVLSSVECSNGAEVTATPLNNPTGYISPSTKGYCIGDAAVLKVRLRRRVLDVRLQAWIDFASENGNWGLAAHAWNERYALHKDSDVAKAEGFKFEALEASARFMGLNPSNVVSYDTKQQTYLMSTDFTSAVRKWKVEHGLKGTETKLDYDFYISASNVTSEALLYQTPR